MPGQKGFIIRISAPRCLEMIRAERVSAPAPSNDVALLYCVPLTGNLFAVLEQRLYYAHSRPNDQVPSRTSQAPSFQAGPPDQQASSLHFHQPSRIQHDRLVGTFPGPRYPPLPTIKPGRLSRPHKSGTPPPYHHYCRPFGPHHARRPGQLRC